MKNDISCLKDEGRRWQNNSRIEYYWGSYHS